MKTEDKITKYLINESIGILSIQDLFKDVQNNLDIEEPKKAKGAILNFELLLATEIKDMQTILDGDERDMFDKNAAKLFFDKLKPFLRKLQSKPEDIGLRKKVNELFIKLEKEMKKY